MIITTTPTIEGREIYAYCGVVFGEVAIGVDFSSLVGDSVPYKELFGGRVSTYEEELIKAKNNALAEMERRAAKLGADAVVGVYVDCKVLGQERQSMLAVSVSGTAVKLK